MMVSDPRSPWRGRTMLGALDRVHAAARGCQNSFYTICPPFMISIILSQQIVPMSARVLVEHQ